MLPDRSPVVEQVVPLDLEATAVSARCFALEAMPQQWSVSPQGQLWLRVSDESWRVVDAFGSDTQQQLPAAVTALVARDSDRALAIIDGELVDIEGEWPLPLQWPTNLATPSSLCGDPSTDANGFVLADGLVHRDRDQWWSWTSPSGDPWADVAWMATNSGSCIGGDDDLWLGLGTGETWRITGDLAQRIEALDGAQSQAVALVDPLGAAAVIEGRLVVGDRGAFVDYRFEAGEASSLSAGGESLWVVAGDQLHRLLDGEFTVAQLDGEPVSPQTLVAEDGGGVWTLTEAEACHLGPTPPVRVEGVHHLQRSKQETVDIAVELFPGLGLSEARLDDAPLTLTLGESGQWLAEPQTMDEGWHVLEIDAEDGDTVHTRRLRFEQRRVGDLNWVEHMAPLFEEHCSGGACHGPDLDEGAGTRPDLSSYAAWLDREDKILERVVMQGDMPPFGARQDTWGLDAALTVAEWFETGAEQGE